MPRGRKTGRRCGPSILLLCSWLAASSLATPASALQAGEVRVDISGPTASTVSPFLTGMNVVYSHESMPTWSDGSKTKALQDAGISCMRYPGGHVVSFWDWEFPYHSAYRNFWDPSYIDTLTAHKKDELKKENGHRMTLDDFFKVCRAARLEPIVGVNMFQGYKFNRLDESIAKAVRLVESCKKRHPRVTHYFLDNEAGHQPAKGNHVPIDDYIALIPAYSKAIKAAQPDAKIIVNAIRWNRVGDMIKKAGAHFDIVDSHWYYSNRKWGLFYIDDWREQKGTRQFGKEVSQFRNWKKTSGHDHLKLALLEWNLGPATGKENSDKSSALLQGLVQADMLMQFIENDIYMAACWPLMWDPPGKSNSSGFRNFFDPDTGTASPSRHIFRWFSMASEGKLLKSEQPRHEGFQCTAVLSKDGKAILVYLLNRSSEEGGVTVRLPRRIDSVSAMAFGRGKDVNSVTVSAREATVSGDEIKLVMPNTSLVFIEARVR